VSGGNAPVTSRFVENHFERLESAKKEPFRLKKSDFPS